MVVQITLVQPSRKTNGWYLNIEAPGKGDSYWKPSFLASNFCKWDGNPYKMAETKWITGVIPLLIGVITYNPIYNS